MKLGFIGCGNMGGALMRAMASDSSFDLLVCDRNSAKLNDVRGIAQTIRSSSELSKESDIIFLCVKPQDIDSVLKEIKDDVQGKLIVSIAAGISLDFIEKRIPRAKTVRVMPNLPCVVGEMAAGFAVGKNCRRKDAKTVHDLLAKSGVALEVAESSLDAITGLSGSGPAFVAYLIEAFAQAGREQGLEKETAYKLAIQTFLGTALLLKEKKIEATRLIEMVSSPNGTTLAGRSVLEQSDVREIILKTVQQATQRSKELRKNG